MAIMAVAEWQPDMPDLSEATNIASNVIALTPQSYGPMRELSAYTSNALDADCIGMGSAEDTTLDHHTFAGTASKLFVVDGGAVLWLDASGTAYATAAGENWRFVQYKNLELATNFTDPIQSYDMIAGVPFADLSADAPNARYLAVAKGFVISANTYDAVGGLNPARIWWSAVNDPGNWPTPGTAGAQQVMSDYNDLLGPMGGITGLAPNLSGCDCAVFFERGVFRMIFSGPPAVFDFYPASAVRGCPAPNSIVSLGSYVYYLGEDGFYVFDGNVSVPIGANKVDRWFFSQLNQADFDLVIGAPDISAKAICWIFKSVYAPTSLPDQMLVYRWDIQRWTIGAVTAEWLARIPVTTTTAGAPPAIAPLIAGQLQLAAVDQGGHLAFFNGSNMAAQIGTKVVQITPDARTFINATRPLVDSGAPSGPLLTETGTSILTELGETLDTEESAAVISVAISSRNSYQEGETFGPESYPDVSGQCSYRTDGRYQRGRITVLSGIWSVCAGLDVTGVRAGSR